MPARRSVEAAPRGPSHSAPYGQACLHCFKAKCRCVSRPDGDGCERCHRLQKTCHSSEAIRKRSRPKAASPVLTSGTSDERVANIEEKLDGIMSMLQSVTQAPAPATAAALRDIFGGRMDEHLRGAIIDQLPLPPAQPTKNRPQCQHTPVSLSSPATADGSSSNEGASVTGNSAQQRPFLLRCIVAATTTLVRDKVAQGRAIKELLAKEMLLENKSNLDLLLGLLVYIAWGSDPMVSRSGTLSRLVMMAQSIVCDMRLNKPLPVDQHLLTTYTSSNEKCDEKGYDREDGAEGAVDTDQEKDTFLSEEEETLEKQRAVLGCFLITSSTSIYFAQIDGMRWTPQMDDCLRAVEAHTSCLGDFVLAYQVRLQQVVQRAIHSREHEAALPLYITQAFQTQLEELKGRRPQFPPTSPRNLDQDVQNQLWGTIFTAHEHYVELSLNEMTFSANYSPSPEAAAQTTATDGTEAAGAASDVDRVQCYWRSVHAIRALCDSLLEGVPATSFAGYSFMVWAQLSRAIVTLVRLSTLPPLAPLVEVSIDTRSVRATIDLLDVLDRFAERLKSAAAGLGRGLWLGPQRQIDDIFGRVAHLVRVLRAAVATRLEASEVGLIGDSHVGGIPGAGEGDRPPWAMVESVLAQTTVGWGDIWLEGMLPRF
ncbi:hypothetical protein Sste5346_001498 [Sporothrix stenoceras]|uniref:Zn(2)-C6 fungal-type domain-containing protein n=1 Tax=Sporothrix stenoceras TaxID=5173 RepID=A0ABR3ZM73_9PEZI